MKRSLKKLASDVTSRFPDVTSYVKLRRSLDVYLPRCPYVGQGDQLQSCSAIVASASITTSTERAQLVRPQATTPAATTPVPGVRIGGAFDSISASGPAGGQLATAGGGREAPKESDFLGQGGFTASQAIDPDQRPSL